MKLKRPEIELPNDGQYVLVHIKNRLWTDPRDPFGVFWKVVRFVDRDERKFNPNNKKPYLWREFGPGTYFGQDVDYWIELPHVKT